MYFDLKLYFCYLKKWHPAKIKQNVESKFNLFLLLKLSERTHTWSLIYGSPNFSNEVNDLFVCANSFGWDPWLQDCI